MAWTAQQLEAEIARRKKKGLPFDGFAKQLKALKASGAATITKAPPKAPPAKAPPVTVAPNTGPKTQAEKLQYEIDRRVAKGEDPVKFKAALAKLGPQAPAADVGVGGGVDVGGGNLVTDPNLDKTGGNTDPGTTGMGNSATSVDNFLEGIFSNFKPLDLSGAPKILGAEDLAGSRQSVYDSLYRQSTQNFARDKQRELEDQKQELSNRGIPINFSSDGSDLYSRSINSIGERYDARDQAARDAANIGADQSLATQAGVNKTAYDSFMEGAKGTFESQLQSAASASDALQTLMTKYGLDQQSAQAILDRKMNEKIAKMQSDTTKYVANKKGGGGRGGSQDTGPLIAGAAPGFDV
jgi:hypothetical protein